MAVPLNMHVQGGMDLLHPIHTYKLEAFHRGVDGDPVELELLELHSVVFVLDVNDALAMGAARAHERIRERRKRPEGDLVSTRGADRDAHRETRRFREGSASACWAARPKA